MVFLKKTLIAISCILVCCVFIFSLLSYLAQRTNARRMDSLSNSVSGVLSSYSRLEKSYIGLNDTVVGFGKELGNLAADYRKLETGYSKFSSGVDSVAREAGRIAESLRQATAAGGGLQESVSGFEETNSRFADELRQLQKKYGFAGGNK